MKTITITLEEKNVVVTDGNETDTSYFNKITDDAERALIALANFYGYEPAELFNFDGGTWEALNKL